MKVIKIKFFPGKRNFANTNAANDAVSVCSTVMLVETIRLFLYIAANKPICWNTTK